MLRVGPWRDWYMNPEPFGLEWDWVSGIAQWLEIRISWLRSLVMLGPSATNSGFTLDRRSSGDRQAALQCLREQHCCLCCCLCHLNGRPLPILRPAAQCRCEPHALVFQAEANQNITERFLLPAYRTRTKPIKPWIQIYMIIGCRSPAAEENTACKIISLSLV